MLPYNKRFIFINVFMGKKLQPEQKAWWPMNWKMIAGQR